jgi:hypothetical protein
LGRNNTTMPGNYCVFVVDKDRIGEPEFLYAFGELKDLVS